MKIGFIDYFLDEWHANTFPAEIKELSGGKAYVAYAYGKIDSPREGGMTNADWCKTHGVEQIFSIEELVEKSDAILVLSPDNPEQHEELCQIPLKSGKPVYVDKTFADTKAAAERIFAIANAHNTPCFSASALPFTEEHQAHVGKEIESIVSIGAGTIQHYSVHQVEPILMLMGTQAKQVMFTGTEAFPAYTIEFADGRRASVSFNHWGTPFGLVANFKDGNAQQYTIQSDFKPPFIKALLNFFENGVIPLNQELTITGVAIIEAAQKGMKAPYTWVQV